MNRKFYALLSMMSGLVLVVGLLLSIELSSALARPVFDQTQVISEGLAYLQSQQGENGGILGFSGSSDPDTTARSVLAFITAKQPADEVIAVSGNTMLDYLATQAISFTHDTTGTIFPGRAGLLLSAVALAGEDPNDFGGMNLVSELEASFHPDTGVYSTTALQGYSSGQASDLNQAWVILGLSLAEVSLPEEAVRYLFQTQGEDGSWGFSDPDTTALAVTALITSKRVTAQDQAIQNALGYFHATQLPNGGWKPSWDTDPLNADSTGWILQALFTAGEDPTGPSWTIEGTDPVQALLSLQKPDGSIGGTYANAYSTAEAIIGLSGVTFSEILSPPPSNQAGLAVFPADGTVYTACISFEAESISSLDLLQRSGLNTETATNPNQGTAVCMVNGVGCPSSDCFCNMPEYWSFWRQSEGSWVYSAVGSDQSTVVNGDVNAWSWGVGDPPGMISFQNICEGVPFEIPTATPSSIPPTEPPTPSQGEPITQDTATAQPVDTAAESQNNIGAYIVYGSILVVLGLLIYYLIHSRRK